MKLYYSPGACSLAPHIALREAGLSFETERVDLGTKRCAEGDYTQVNPKGSVPALKLDGGELLTEAAIVLQYVADQAPDKKLIPAPGTMERYRAQEWLNFIATDLHKGFSVLFGADRNVANSEGNQQLKHSARENLYRRLAVVGNRLEKNDYLLGSQFSVADAYLFTVLRWAKAFQVELGRYPGIERFMARMQARPAVKAALETESPKN